MKSLRKRAIAKACGKYYRTEKNGGFTICDPYGSVGTAFKSDNKFILDLIKS